MGATEEFERTVSTGIFSMNSEENATTCYTHVGMNLRQVYCKLALQIKEQYDIFFLFQ